MDEHPGDASGVRAEPGTAPPPPPPPAMPATMVPAPRRPSVVGVGVAAAIRWAVGTVVLLGAIAALLAVLFANAQDGPPPVLAARIGGIVFFLFNRVGFVVGASSFDLSGLGGNAPPGLSAVSATFVVAILGGTFIAIAMLMAAGRSIGRKVEGPPWVRGLHGAKVALPYAVIYLLASFALSFHTSFPQAGVAPGRVSVHPSYLAAFFWPLFLGLFGGFVGGYRSADGVEGTGSAWQRWIRGAVSGGLAMVLVGLALAFVGLLVMAAVMPDATRSYFKGAFESGAVGGSATIMSNVLVLPNMAAWVLFPSMGACIGASAGGLSICALSYTHFPSAAGAGSQAAQAGLPSFAGPPTPYFLFILAPAIAVIVGGMLAARRAAVRDRREGAAVGAAAGVAFALLALALAVVSSIVVKVGAGVTGFGFAGTARAGAEPLGAMLLALPWGVVGGAIGGLAQARKLPAVAVATVGVEPPPPVPPPPSATSPSTEPAAPEPVPPASPAPEPGSPERPPPTEEP